MGQIQGLSADVLNIRRGELMKQFGLDSYQHTRIQHLSKGNKQKVNIIQALLPNPELLLLDEPISGLDPDSQKRLVDILTQLKKAGTTIIFTCHESFFAERLADRSIHVTQQNIKEVMVSRENNQYRTIEFSGATEALLSFVSSSPFIMKHVCQTSSPHIISVHAVKSNEVIGEIIALGGTIQFVSRQMDMLPMLGSNDNGKKQVKK